MRIDTIVFIAGISILLTILAVLLGTAVACVRAASRTRLIEALGEGGDTVDRFFRFRRHYARALLLVQHSTQFGFAIVLFHVFGRINDPTTRWTLTGGAWLVWLLVFGVGIPVGWARHAGDAYMAATLPAMELLRRVLTPLLIAVNGVEEIVRRLAGAPREPADRSEQFEMEIMDAVSHGEISGMMNPAEKEIIRSALTLDETSVGEVMTPRTDIVGVESTATLNDVREALLSDGHSRVPVYEESLDHVVGILYAKDLLRITDPLDFRLKETMRPAIFVPETKDLSSLLREFQQTRVHIAIVLDEYGGTAGLVTLEDIMEQLIGDIADEHETPPAPPILRIDDRTAEVEGRVRMEDLNETLGIELPVDDAYDTVAGFVFSKLGRIPSVGESTEDGGVRIEVTDAGDRSIRKLRLHLPEAAVTSE